MEQHAKDPFSVLRSFVRQPKARERCDLCGVGLLRGHDHLIDPGTQKLVCACTACALLFPSNGPTKYKRVPRRVQLFGNFQMTDSQWDTLLIPIGMAYFVTSTIEGRVFSFYPSPAGATQSMLELDSWNDIVEQNPALAAMEPDVEALLVNRLDHVRGGSEYYLVPVDRCYELVGLIRSQWRGLSGGTEMWEEIRRFFNELKAQAVPEAKSA